MEISIDAPLNGLSFGQVTVNILRGLSRRGIKPNIFPVGQNGDLTAYNISQEFNQWLGEAIGSAAVKHTRDTKTLKLWHINGAHTSHANKRVLLTFHETDELTLHEKNTLQQQDAVLVTSSYTQRVMESAGLTNVVYCPLGFDSDSFFQTHKKYMDDSITCFGLAGKLENRKHHLKVIRAWVKRYGNNPSYRLNCALSNKHMDPQMQAAMIGQALEGKRVFNITFLNYMNTNAEYNDFLNANNIFLGMSGGEGFDLPTFHSAALGKQIVALNAHVYPDYLNKQSAVLVNPSGMIPVYDNIFFVKGQPFNQGNIFTFSDDDFIQACEEAESRRKFNPVNREGKKLQEKFSYEQTINKIIETL